MRRRLLERVELNPLHAEPEAETPPPSPAEPTPEPAQPEPEKPRSRRIDMLTLLEMAENGEPIPPWNG